VWQSAVIFFIAYFAYQDAAWIDTLSFGFSLVFSMMITSLLHVLLQTTRLNWLIIGSVILSFSLYLGFSLIFDAVCVKCVPGESPYKVTYHMLRQGRFWFTSLLTIVTALLPRFAIKCLYNTIANPFN
jgi:magnesium-transporting ATPase (P-type)